MAVEDADVSLDALTRAKLARLLGEERGHKLYLSVLASANVSRIESADDLLRFANVLMEESGFVGAMGGVLRVQAILRGAKG